MDYYQIQRRGKHKESIDWHKRWGKNSRDNNNRREEDKYERGSRKRNIDDQNE